MNTIDRGIYSFQVGFSFYKYCVKKNITIEKKRKKAVHYSQNEYASEGNVYIHIDYIHTYI